MTKSRIRAYPSATEDYPDDWPIFHKDFSGTMAGFAENILRLTFLTFGILALGSPIYSRCCEWLQFSSRSSLPGPLEMPHDHAVDRFGPIALHLDFACW